MIDKSILIQVLNKIKSAKTIAIISHMSPDGDTLGAGLALYCAIKKLGKEPYLFCEDLPPKRLKYLPNHEVINKQSLAKYDIAIVVDTASHERMGSAVEEFNRAKVKIVVDHHVTNENFGDINLVYNCAATCMVVAVIIDRLNVMDATIATLLMCGIVTDSGMFGYSSVTSQTFAIASRLMEFDVPLKDIVEKVFKQVSKNAFMLKNRVLNKIRFFDDNKIAMIIITDEDFRTTNTTNEHTEGIVAALREIEGVDVAIALSQANESSFKVSLRSSESVNCSKIAMSFGGGGHIRASGCRLHGELNDIVERLLAATRKEIC